jgi:hypothetical protein
MLQLIQLPLVQPQLVSVPGQLLKQAFPDLYWQEVQLALAGQEVTPYSVSGAFSGHCPSSGEKLS